MVRASGLLGVALLVVLVGCGGAVVDEDTPSVTPASGLTDTATEEAVPFDRLGIVDGRFTDPGVSAARHRRVLARTSYAVEAVQVVRLTGSNRSGIRSADGRFDGAGGFVAMIEVVGAAFDAPGPVRSAYWSNGSVVARVNASDHSSAGAVLVYPTGEPVPPPAALPVDPRFESELADVLAITAPTTVEHTSGARGRLGATTVGFEQSSGTNVSP